MPLFTLISGESVHMAEGDKIIPKKDFGKIKKAEEIVKQTEKEAEDLRQKIEEEALVIKEKAQEEGFQEGLQKLNQQLVHLEKLSRTTSEEMKKQILPILLSSLKKVIGEELLLKPDRITDIVIQALKSVIQHHHITIYVNKDDLKTLETKKKKLKSMLQQVEVFSLQERADIETGGCIIETEAGIINAQLDNQIRALEAALKTLMGKKTT